MTGENPYRTPTPSEGPSFAASPTPGVWREGKMLRMARGATLPKRCIRCNAPTEARIRRELSWSKPVFLLLPFIVTLGYKATIEMGYCEMHQRKRWQAIATGGILVLVGFGLMGGTFAFRTPKFELFIVGIAVFLAGLLYGMFASNFITAKKIDERYIWLDTISPEYLADLPPWEDG